MMKNVGRKVSFGLFLASLCVFAVPAHAATATRTTAFTYTAQGLLATEVVEPNTASQKLTTTYTYDSFGNITVQAKSGANITTRAETTIYDAKGQFATAKANALTHSETWAYDARFGAPTSHTGPNGLTTTWSYDGFGRKTLEVRPDGTRTSWSYVYCTGINGGTAACPTNGAYLVQEMPLASDGATQNGPWSKTYYDKLGRSIGTDTQGFDGSTIRQAVEYNHLGRVYRASRPYFLATGTPRWTVNTYDALGRVISTTNPDNSVATFAFHGLTTSTTNPLSQTTTTVLNARGQTASVTDSGGNITAYAYDPFGNLKTVTDAAGNVTTYTYDVRGNKIGAQDPDMGAWTYTYNVLGKVLTMTDAKKQTTTYAYDKLDRPTQIVEPDRTTTYVYDTRTKGIGALTSATIVASGTTTYNRNHTYDSLGRPYETTLAINGTSYLTRGVYDANSRLLRVTYPSSFVMSYEYTSLGFLKKAKNYSDSSTYWTADVRDAEGHLTQQTLGNGVVTTRTYNPNTGRVSTIQAGTSNAIANFSYTFDSIGNLTSRGDANTGLSETFGYDNLNRLTQSVVNNGAPKTMAYNAIGNIVNKSDSGAYTYPPAGGARPHAVQSIAGALNTSFTYDANGNMLSGNGRTYTYTAANRTKTITTGGSTITYGYDDANQRVSQAAPEGTTTYINNSAFGMRLEKVVGSGGAVKWNEYLFAGDEEIGVRVNNVTSPFLHYYTGDHLGSISVITNAAKAVVERLSFDPWGKRRYPTGQDDPTNSITSQATRGFTNHEHITTTGLINMNARVYDPAIGRFLSPDSLVEDYYKSQILNRYSYVGNNPLSFKDMTGQCFLGCFWKSKIFRTILVLAAVITLNVELLPAALTHSIEFVALEGALSSMAITGDLSSAGKGALSSTIFFGVGSIAQAAGWAAQGASVLEQTANIAMHGAAGGLTSVVQGGKFQSGFLAAGFSEFAGPQIDKLGLDPIGGGIARTMAGGLASVAGGGKFENGAITSAFQYLYNRCLHGQCYGTGDLTPKQEQAKYNSSPLYRMRESLRDLFDNESAMARDQMPSWVADGVSCPINESSVRTKEWAKENDAGEFLYHADRNMYKQPISAGMSAGSECSYVAGRLVTGDRWAGTANTYPDSNVIGHLFLDRGGPKYLGNMPITLWEKYESK